MKDMNRSRNHYLMPGNLFVHEKEHCVTTVLGSCVSVCLWDPSRRIGGINHYMLPLWNGEGLASPRYGNIAIVKLIERMFEAGAEPGTIKAKIFGGGDVLGNTDSFINIGRRNILVAQDILRDAKIPVIGADTGGKNGRKLVFNTASGDVYIKLLKKQVDEFRVMEPATEIKTDIIPPFFF